MKHLKLFENFREWKDSSEQHIIDTLISMIEHSQEMLYDLTGYEDDNLAPEDAIIKLRELDTQHSNELADQIDNVLDLLAEFDIEKEIELSKLN